MKRLVSILTASAVVFSMLVAPAHAKDKGDKSDPGGSNGSQNSGNAGGGRGDAADSAPGQARDNGQSAKAGAPGQAGAAARSGQVAPQLAGVAPGTRVNVVEVNDLIKGTRRSAVNKSLAANRAGINRLRSGLVRLRLSGLNRRDAGDAIATRREPDGSLTVYVDRGAD